MAVFKPRKSRYWWYKFVWQGRLRRETTKQTNKRVAEQMEAARKTQMAKREVGIKDPVPVPTLEEFARNQFLPFAEKQFSTRPATLAFYENGVANLLERKPLAYLSLDAVTTKDIAAFAASRKQAGLATASVNRELQVLRRMFRLAQEWGKVGKLLPRVSVVPTENHRERVLTREEEDKYLAAAKPLLKDAATILLDCAMRPDECFRLRWDQVRDGSLRILHGKTESARRAIPPVGQSRRRDRGQARIPERLAMDLPGAYQHGTHREVQPEEAALQSDQELEDRGLRPLRVPLPPHLLDAVGRAHGTLHACLPSRPQRLRHDEAVRASADSDGEDVMQRTRKALDRSSADPKAEPAHPKASTDENEEVGQKKKPGHSDRAFASKLLDEIRWGLAPRVQLPKNVHYECSKQQLEKPSNSNLDTFLYGCLCRHFT
jgi:integrase